jgi:hypothetical protein
MFHVEPRWKFEEFAKRRLLRENVQPGALVFEERVAGIQP